MDGLDAVFPDQAVQAAHQTNKLITIDDALALVATVLANWSIVLTGNADVSDGGWTCTLRKSSTLGDDTTTGVGKALLTFFKTALGRCGIWERGFKTAQSCSGTIWIYPVGHSWAQRPQPLQKSRSNT